MVKIMENLMNVLLALLYSWAQERLEAHDPPRHDCFALSTIAWTCLPPVGTCSHTIS